jgi:hypothetical protein
MHCQNYQQNNPRIGERLLCWMIAEHVATLCIARHMLINACGIAINAGDAQACGSLLTRAPGLADLNNS